jgi:hypothetical protein
VADATEDDLYAALGISENFMDKPKSEEWKTCGRGHKYRCACSPHVEWHMREAWCELMFADVDQAAKATRDPVALA